MNKHEITEASLENLKHELEFLYFELGRMGRDSNPVADRIRHIEAEMVERRIKRIAPAVTSPTPEIATQGIQLATHLTVMKDDFIHIGHPELDEIILEAEELLMSNK